MLSPADRQSFSNAIIQAAQQSAGLDTAKAQIQAQADSDQQIDTANKNLFDPVNTLINSYQTEFNAIDGNVRTSILEQNVIDSSNKILGNFFFPNNIQLSIPALSAKNNVWTQLTPFGLAFGLGKNYDQSYSAGTSEQQLITDALALIASATAYTNIQLTTGQQCENSGGTCSIPMYLTQVDCEAHSGIWTPMESIVTYPDIQTLKTNLMTKIVALTSQANAEVTALTTNAETNSTFKTQNQAAINYVNNTLVPAINTWLAYADFNTAHGQTTCAGFNGYNADLLAPTKLHSIQLTALQSVLNARSTFLTTRISQLNTNLGSITQSVDDGTYAGTGLYKKRLDYLNLRINLMAGSLTDLTNSQQSINAQTQIQSTLATKVSTYMAIVPTTKLAASGNGTAIISLVNPTLYSVGDNVYIMSDTQNELQFAIKTISGNSIQLNAVLPSKYTTIDNVRFYKDIS